MVHMQDHITIHRHLRPAQILSTVFQLWEDSGQQPRDLSHLAPGAEPPQGNHLAGMRVKALAEQRRFDAKKDPCRSSWSNSKKLLRPDFFSGLGQENKISCGSTSRLCQ